MDVTGEEDWSDWEGDDVPARSLLENKMLPSAKEAFKYDKDTYGFDVLAIRKKLGLDFYGCVKLVNFVRTEVSEKQEHHDPKAAAVAIEAAVISSQGSAFADDRYLQPVLEDDAILLNLEELPVVHLAGGEDEGCSDEDDDYPAVTVDGGTEEGKNTTGHDKVDGVIATGREETTRSQAPTLLWAGEGTAVSPREEVYSSRAIWQLERENASLREALQAVEVRMARANEVLRSLVAVGGGAGDVDGKQAGTEDRGGSLGVVDNDSYYFRSYAHWGVHETMLTDTVRTGAYERAICDNAAFFKNKVVLDVGCGTGVLSCFAARAGARKVIGVDRSDIVVKARDVVRDNGFDAVVTLIQGKVEDVDIGVDEVDVIISEWMGYCLFFESMLSSVLFARDKYLAKGGVVLPDRTPLFIQGWRDPHGRLQFWENVHGLNFSSMAHLPLDEASIEVIRREDLTTERCLCQDFNIETAKEKDLDFEAPFEMVVHSPGTLSGLVISFDTGFFARSDDPPQRPAPLPTPPPATATKRSPPALDNGDGTEATSVGKERPSPSWFSTGPESQPTHWKQTLLWLRPTEKPEALDAGDVISGRLALHRDEVNPRELRLTVTWAATRRSTDRNYGGVQKYSVC